MRTSYALVSQFASVFWLYFTSMVPVHAGLWPLLPRDSPSPTVPLPQLPLDVRDSPVTHTRTIDDCLEEDRRSDRGHGVKYGRVRVFRSADYPDVTEGAINDASAVAAG